MDRHTPRRIGTFAVAGAVGAVVDTTLLIVLAGLGAPILVAKTAGWVTAVATIFAVNDRVTFADVEGIGSVARRFGRSLGIRASGFVLATTVLVGLSSAGVPLVAANLTGIGAGAVVNYLAESRYCWDLSGVTA